MASPAPTIAASAPGDGGKQRLRLWLRLLGSATLIEREIRARLRRDYGATLPRFDLMAALDRAPNGLSMSELSRRLMVSNGNVTGVVAKLESEGIVRRWSPPDDRRCSMAALTTRGRTRFAAMAGRHEAWITELLGGLDPVEIDRLMTLLGQVKASVRQSQGERE